METRGQEWYPEAKHLALHQGALNVGEDLNESGGRVRTTRAEAVSSRRAVGCTFCSSRAAEDGAAAAMPSVTLTLRVDFGDRAHLH